MPLPIEKLLAPLVQQFLTFARGGVLVTRQELDQDDQSVIWNSEDDLDSCFSVSIWPSDGKKDGGSVYLYIDFEIVEGACDSIIFIYNGGLKIRFGNESGDIVCGKFPALKDALQQLLQLALPSMEADFEEFMLMLPPETGAPPITD